MKILLRYLISICGLLLAFSWGKPPPITFGFSDPLFEELSHQNVIFNEPQNYIVNEENFVIIQLEKPTFPSGYMLSVLVDTITSPDSEPEIQGWYPKTSIKPLKEGFYELSIRVNLMYKGSCGGILVATIAQTKISFTAKKTQ